MEKLKEIYEAANVEIILFEFSDIVTQSLPTGGDGTTPPNDGDWDSWTQ